MEYAVEGNWGSFLMENDCIEVIHQISGNGVVVEELKRLRDIPHIPGIIFVPWDANMAAHSVAHYVARNIGYFNWLEIRNFRLMQIINDEISVTYSSNRNVYSGFASIVGYSNIVLPLGM